MFHILVSVAAPVSQPGNLLIKGIIIGGGKMLGIIALVCGIILIYWWVKKGIISLCRYVILLSLLNYKTNK